MGTDTSVLMRVDTILVDPETNAPVIVLRGEQDSNMFLPICIGQSEAAAIASILANVTLPRPMTHDLFYKFIEFTGVSIERVSITRMEEDTFYAELVVRRPSGEFETLDARPSDSIALGLRAGASLHVAEEVLAQAGGYSAADEEEAGQPDANGDSLEGQLLSDVRLEDLEADTFGKYKM